MGCKENKNGFNLTQCWTQILLIGVKEQEPPNAGFFHCVFNDKVKFAQRLVYFIALTSLGLNNSLDQLPTYVQWWVFLPYYIISWWCSCCCNSCCCCAKPWCWLPLQGFMTMFPLYLYSSCCCSWYPFDDNIIKKN